MARHPLLRLVALAAAVGSVLLTLPVAKAGPGGATPIEAIFTAVSAISVTGHVVVDTSSYWTLGGQIVILALIQLGGLGVVLVDEGHGGVGMTRPVGGPRDQQHPEAVARVLEHLVVEGRPVVAYEVQQGLDIGAEVALDRFELLGRPLDARLEGKVQRRPERLGVAELLRHEVHEVVEERLALATQLDMTPRSVQVWFQNRRQRTSTGPAAEGSS